MCLLSFTAYRERRTARNARTRTGVLPGPRLPAFIWRIYDETQDCLSGLSALYCHSFGNRPARHVAHPLQSCLLRHPVLVSVSATKPSESDRGPPVLHDQRISAPPLPGHPPPVHFLPQTSPAAGAPLMHLESGLSARRRVAYRSPCLPLRLSLFSIESAAKVIICGLSIR